MYRVISFILSILCGCLLFAGTPSRFSPYRSPVYAPHSNINTMTEDSYGLIWIGTENGLFLFNGYEYFKYTQDINIPNCLPNNNCRHVFEDSQKRVWICTDNGIAQYVRVHNNFKRLNLTGLSNHNFLDVKEDNDGTLWTITFNELIHFTADGDIIDVAPFPNIICFCLDNDNNRVLVGSHLYGIAAFDKKTKTYGKLNPSTDEDRTASMHPYVMRVTSNKHLFVGSRDKGLYIIDLKTGKISPNNVENHPEFFQSNFVYSLFEDSKQTVWIGFVNGQLLEYDLLNEKFHIPDFQYPIGVDQFTVSDISEDHEHNIWVGTHNYWIYIFNRSTSNFQLFQKKQNQDKSLSHNTVTCFADDKDEILIGTDGGGLNIIDKKTLTVRHETRLGKVILDLHRAEQEGEFWISTWGNTDKVLFKYNTHNGTFKGYDFNEKNADANSYNLLRDICIDGPYVWISTDGEGLFRLDTRTEKFDNKYNCNEPIFDKHIPQWVNHIMKDSRGRLWLCSSEGIILYEKNVCLKLAIEDISIENLQNEVKMSIEDHDGDIFFITANNGLLKFDEKKMKFVNVSKKYDLPSSLCAICEDDNHELWITSSEDIIRLDKTKNGCFRFNMQNDLNGHTFTTNAIHYSNNYVYAGSNNGFFSFKTDDIKLTPSNPNVYLGSLYVGGEKQRVTTSKILKNTLAFTDTLYLKHTDNNFSIDFFCVDLDNVENVHYHYKLAGFNNEWTNAYDTRRANYTNLQPGTYTFQVKANTVNANSNFYTKPLTIIIKHPWWQTWWCKAALFVLFFSSIFFFTFLKEKQMREKQTKLEELVQERTEELQHQKESLVIQNKRLDDAIDTKNKILSVIAHDLRNPLAALVGNITILNDETDSKSTPKIRLIYQSAKTLQAQMENLLDWAKLQNQTLFYSPADTSVAALTKESLTILQDLLKKKNISTRISNHCQKTAYIDRRMINSVFRNILTNAIKYSFEDGTIEITISESENFIEWSVQDHGVGMPQERTSKIFKKGFLKSTYGTNNEKGSGLGLKICQQFISVNNGEIAINSNEGKGTTVTVKIPKGSEAETALTNEELTEKTDNAEKTTSTQYNILVVEDNIEMMEYICELLQSSYHIETATNGADALDIARKKLPDLILSDIVMPKMNGKELCQHIRKESLTQHIPIILLSSEDTIDNQIDGLNIGANDYITKPFVAEILKAKILTILKNSELQRNERRSQILQTNIDVPPSVDDSFVLRIKEIILQNIASANLNVEFIAEKTALSRVQLFRKMKAITGCSPSEYIKAIRLDYAAELLAKSKKSVAETAYATGFSDPKYFSNCFSEKFGISPSQYREKNC